MIKRFAVVFCLAAISGCLVAQGPRPSNLGASKLDLGEPGIQWYTTWESAEAEQNAAVAPLCLWRLQPSAMVSRVSSDLATQLRRTVCSRPQILLMLHVTSFVSGLSLMRVLNISSMFARS